MARRPATATATTSQHPASNRPMNGDNPPSTIAAQIVNNHSKASSNQEPKNRELFGQLLKGYLADASSEEPNVELNSKLISVVAEAGLKALLRADPFAQDLSIPQALNSLSVIELTIRRDPQILLYRENDEIGKSPRPPTILWLLPRLMSLIGLDHLGTLQSNVESLIQTCLAVARQKLDSQSELSIRIMYQDCVDSLVNTCKANVTNSSGYPSTFRAPFPPPGAISKFWPETEHLVAIPHDCQITIKSVTQAMSIAITLTQSIINLDGSENQTNFLKFSNGNISAWVVDCISSLWMAFKSQCSEDKVSDVINNLLLQFLQIVKTFCFPDIRLASDYRSSNVHSVLLVEVIADMLEISSVSTPPPSFQLELARSLLILRKYHKLKTPYIHSLVDERVVPVISDICMDSARFDILSKDLQIVICTYVDFEHDKQLCSTSLSAIRSIKLQPNQLLEDQTLANIYDELPKTNSQDSTFLINGLKRQRISSGRQNRIPGNSYRSLVSNIAASLGYSEKEDLNMLHLNARDSFKGLSETQRNSFLEKIQILACSGAGTLQPPSEERYRSTRAFCITCDNIPDDLPLTRKVWDNPLQSNDRTELLSILEQLLETPELQRSTKPRVLAVIALRRILNHISDPGILNLANSSIGQWCLKSMHSSLRELRIAAARTIPVFLQDSVPEDTKKKNRILALEYFKTLSERKEMAEQETLIIAWGEAARVCGNDELNIILLQLVEYLGHTNSMLTGLAYNELSSLAEHLRVTPLEMLQPFWRTIGISVLRDLFSRPQKAQQLSELLGMSVNSLLGISLTDTLPLLVLMKRKDVLKRMAAARGPKAEIQDVCMQPRRNLAAILSLLLLQHSASTAELCAMETLREIAPAFSETDLPTLVKLEPILIACELLKASADEDSSKKRRVHQAIHTLAVLSERKTNHSKSSSKSEKLLAAFFESHVLGIMTYFSELIDSSREKQPVSERLRCLGAIEEMIGLAKGRVGPALPQIRACLQSALEVNELRDKSFSTWSSLLAALEEEDVELLVDHTFSIIAKYWNLFSSNTQENAYNTIERLLKTHEALVQDKVATIPSLSGIPVMAKFESELVRLKSVYDIGKQFQAFARRCDDENAVVVHRALLELKAFLESHQRFLHESAISQQPNPGIAEVCRSLLDVAIRFPEEYGDISCLNAQCLGLIGTLDPNRIETAREKQEIMVLSDFEKANEVIDFVAFILEHVLVKSFHSASNAKAQGFLAYVMQELLKFCGYNELMTHRTRSSQGDPEQGRWIRIPESVRNTLTPFLSSKYVITNPGTAPLQNYPIFSPGMQHGVWLRSFAFDLLQRGKGDNARMIFPVISRVVRGHDLSVASFILPFVVLNVILGGTEKEVEDTSQELLTVLRQEVGDKTGDDAENLKQCIENVFQVIDYMTKWLQEKRRALTDARMMASRTGIALPEFEEVRDVSQISSVERIIHQIPAETIANRAVECGSYARALLHWEQYIRQQEAKSQSTYDDSVHDELYSRLQRIYESIDEPDGVEGISIYLHVLDPLQQVRQRENAGRWTAAQSWYELELAERPSDRNLQIKLLQCLKESGQYDSLLNCLESFPKSGDAYPSIAIPYGAEAAWVTAKWSSLEKFLANTPEGQGQDFNIGIGNALLDLRARDKTKFLNTVSTLRESVSRRLTSSTTASIKSSHFVLLELHALYELEAISGYTDTVQEKRLLLETLDRRLDAVGAFMSEKQYLLGIRRATMQLSSLDFTDFDIASAWLTSARLARKANFTGTAFNAVLHAAKLGNNNSKIEHARLLWKDGHHRKAIQTLEGAIAIDAFVPSESNKSVDDATNSRTAEDINHSLLTARAHLLLAKWLDRAGQSQSGQVISKYQHAVKAYSRWDKGHYYLGRHYNKILEAEKVLPPSRQSVAFLCGETAKLVVENYTRSMGFGSKYYYQTVPKVLTLWLDLGAEIVEPPSRKNPLEVEMAEQKSKNLEYIHRCQKKYLDRLPAFIFYTAFPQIITRISHPNRQVWEILSQLIIKIVSHHPQQALWSLLAVVKSRDALRANRGQNVLSRVKEISKKGRADEIDLKLLISHGERLTKQLLQACEVGVEARVAHVSLSRDLGFNHKLAPCKLVVPIEATMVAALPSVQGSQHVKKHNAFPRGIITIESVSDDVLVLSSLQRPRKIVVRGSDGKEYGLLCKPKDDLRKDQRLMEFNGMINRALRRDAEASKRQLYIKTYGVTPLNEECGTIEWVDNLKPIRDILVKIYRAKNITINFEHVRVLLTEACSAPSKHHLFTTTILKQFPPVLHEWFTESFPDPDHWFAARLRYTRSCAVMSIVGHILGLGDRHGENILLEEGSGGTFHVDFNCLFDKGLTFEKPELVPFRLTHNMVDAMGATGVEGPWRSSAEISLRICRETRDTLMTILETFVYDPTTDFIGRKKKTVPGVPETPQEVLEGVGSKLQGLLRGESVPLSVEGYVEALLGMARDEGRLCKMYIGWCAFF
ncbi:hypothetical protein M501DRAFT_994296 [Patellaria atrata CBS 101060]|uniref:Serine/threonine-protein kinase MEC1 n=1 Tax=Patellaria atrata CBS 101060 TaxID=1346257 RepID=A0A9P4VVT4_9PEZI|nr:hypothetical protein M501DRAFT_994296 [Patellaria atrata CBS 101060]